MKNLNISVVDKIAKYLQRDGTIVCGNSDYQITFTFDAEWSAYPTKTARFIWNGQYWDQPFSGNVCKVPIISGADSVSVGVYAGDLCTTTPAIIPCKRSILCDSAKINEGNIEVSVHEAVEAAYRAEEAAGRITSILANLGVAVVFGRVDENNVITLVGDLTDNTYTLKYEMEDGTLIDIGEFAYDGSSSGGNSGGNSGGTVVYNVTRHLVNCAISNTTYSVLEGSSYYAVITANSGYTLSSLTVTMGGSPVSVSNGVINISKVTGDIAITASAVASGGSSGGGSSTPTNQIPISINANGTAFVGTNGEKGYKLGTRISASSGNESTSSASDIEVTGFIPIKYDDTIYLKGITITTGTTEVIGFYNASFTKIICSNTSLIFGTSNGEIVSGKINATTANDANLTTDVAYMRISAKVIDENSILTVNQPIS